MLKNVQTTAQLHSSHTLGKLILKILQTRLWQYMNRELPDVRAGFWKGKGTRDQIAKIHSIIKKSREFQKISTSALLTISKPLTGSQQTVENSSRDGNTRTPYLPPEKPVCNHVQLELDMEQQTSSKLGREYVKVVYSHPAYLTFM